MAAELREQLNVSQGEVEHLHRVVAESNSQVDKLNADIDCLRQTEEVSG